MNFMIVSSFSLSQNSHRSRLPEVERHHAVDRALLGQMQANLRSLDDLISRLRFMMTEIAATGVGSSNRYEPPPGRGD